MGALLGTAAGATSASSSMACCAGAMICQAISAFCKKASLFNGLNNPEVFKLFSTIIDILDPIFSFFKISFKLLLDLLSVDSGDTAIGNGFKLPLVISTSIKAIALIGIKTNNNTKKFKYLIILLTSLLHQNLTVNLSIFHNLLLALLEADITLLLLVRSQPKLYKIPGQVYSFLHDPVFLI